MRTIFMHIDDYCLCEILPLECYNACIEQIEKIKEFSSSNGKNKISTDEDLYIIPPPPKTLRDTGLTKDELHYLLSDKLTSYDKIDSPDFLKYDIGEEYDVDAFGETANVTIFYSFNKKTNIVERVWLVMNIKNKPDKKDANSILDLLAELGDYIFVDFSSDIVFKIRDKDARRNYVHYIADWFKRQNQKK